MPKTRTGIIPELRRIRRSRSRRSKQFGLWPLAEAAPACFGTPDWPDDVPGPQAGVEFEVPDVSAACKASLGTRTVDPPYRSIAVTAREAFEASLLVAIGLLSRSA